MKTNQEIADEQRAAIGPENMDAVHAAFEETDKAVEAMIAAEIGRYEALALPEPQASHIAAGAIINALGALALFAAPNTINDPARRGMAAGVIANGVAEAFLLRAEEIAADMQKPKN